MNLVILFTDLNNLFVPYSVLRQLHSLFQSMFSTVILSEVKNSFVPFCRTSVQLSLPQPVLPRQRLSYSSFNFQNPLVSFGFIQ